jgi:poly(3-hydroxybutyrate) depolymerase
VRLRPTRSVLAAALAGLSLAAAALPARADDVPVEPAAVAPTVVEPYGTDAQGVPLYRVGPGQHVPSITAVGHPFKAVVELDTDEGPRSFRVFIPTGLNGPAPTVVAMPGWAQAAEPESYMRWEKVATARHFVVVYPRGADLSFNAGRCCGSAVTHDIDDSAALLRMLEVENDFWPQNPSRLYLTGFSNGGMMAYRFACEHPSLVAGIGVVAAAYVARGSCMPGTAVPAMHIHGRLDATIPWHGTQWSRLLSTSLPTVPQTDAVFGHVDHSSGVAYKNVYLAGVGHVWPHANGAGSYDATGQLAAFLLRFHR